MYMVKCDKCGDQVPADLKSVEVHVCEPSAESSGYTLKSCPFCGGEAHFYYDDNGWNWIECSRCHASSKAAVHAMEDCRTILSEGWNKRV